MVKFSVLDGSGSDERNRTAIFLTPAKSVSGSGFFSVGGAGFDSSGSCSLGCSASPGPTPVEFHADHPFLFMIVHNASRSVLFAGWISDPRALEQHEAAAEAGP